MDGLIIVPEDTVERLLEQDVVVVPGGRGILKLLADQELMQVLGASYDHVRFVCSVCIGSVLLGKAGLLTGKRATTHHLRYDELVEYSEVIPMHERVVIDGKTVTGVSVSPSLDAGYMCPVSLKELHEIYNR